MSAVELDGATLALGSRVVLRRVGFRVEPGEFVGVLGPNGAGKTTLFRALLGLVSPREGRVRVLGRPAAQGTAGIGYMPQLRTAVAEARLSGRAFVAAAVRGQRWGLPLPCREDREAVERALDLVGASALADRPLASLSGGERQRLLLAQALLDQPRLLLLDEPLLGLDPRHQRGVVELVRELQRSLGITVLFSAHELNPLLGALDRVLCLGRQGAAIGTVDDVITGPVLSRLYGTAIEVAHVNGRVFVMAGGQEWDRGCHPHGSHPHAHETYDGHVPFRDGGRHV